MKKAKEKMYTQEEVNKIANNRQEIVDEMVEEIEDLESRLEYANKVNLANIAKINYQSGQIDTFERITGTQEQK